MPDEKIPNPIDTHVGSRIRVRRRALGISQADKATSLNLTFQQIQKYERGSNRISCSKLYQAAVALSVPIEYFFEDYDGGDDFEHSDIAGEEIAKKFLITQEGLNLSAAFPQIKNVKVRRRILDLVRTLADE